MNIYNKKIEKHLMDFIKDNLSIGHMPSSMEMINTINEYKLNLKDNINIIKPIKDIEKININDWNTIKYDIVNNLKIIHEVLNSLYDDINFIKATNSIEINRLSYKMKNLKDKAEKLLINLNSNQSQFSIIGSFNDFFNIDTIETSSQIDIINSFAHNPILKTEVYSNWGVLIETKNKITFQDPIDNLNSRNLTWRAQLTNASQGKAAIDLVIDLRENVLVSDIYLNCAMLKPATISVQILNDKNQWNTINTLRIINDLKFQIGKTTNKIKITLSKEEADKKGLSSYEYYYIIKNISIHKIIYLNESIIKTKGYDIPSKNFTGVYLEAEENLPSGTNIEYTLKFGEIDINLIPKRRIEYKAPVPLYNKSIEQVIPIVQSSQISENALYRQHLSNGSQKAFEIYNGAPLDNIKLFKGYNNWKIETINIQENNIPSLSYFKLNEQLIETTYIPISPYKPGSIKHILQSSGVIKYSISFLNSGAAYKIDRKIVTDQEFKLYINGIMIDTANSTYTINIREGQNEIILLTNGVIGDVLNIDLGLTSTDIPFNLYSNIIEMREVSELDFQYSTNNNKNVFFKIKDSNNMALYVKDNDFNITYGLSYLEEIKDTRSVSMKIKLINNTDNENITPRVMNYKIHFIS